MNNYHAHIYFDLHQTEEARKLFNRAHSECPYLKPWKIYESPVGPHAKPMIELHFQDKNRTGAVKWLRQNTFSWSVLIHEDSGDDVKDHTIGHEWLGPVLPIDFTFFQKVQQDPDLALHKN